MSHTITRPHRFARLTAGLAVAAAATATTLLGAAPASAQTLPVTGSVSGGTLFINGTIAADGIIVTSGANGSVTFRNTSGTAAPGGPGCQQVGTSVQCFGVSRTNINARGGDDTITNGTQLPISAFGGAGNDILGGNSRNDTLRGGSGDDILAGAGGTDQADGQAGTDLCNAETEANCEGR